MPYRPFKRPRLSNEEEPADGTGQARVVRSRLDSPSDPDSTMQDATPERSGMSLDQPKSAPSASNPSGTQQPNGFSQPKDSGEEGGQSAAVGGKQHDVHMQGTSLPAANGFAPGMGSAAAANGTGHVQKGFASSGQKTDDDAVMNLIFDAQPSSSKTAAQKGSDVDAHGTKEQLFENGGSVSPSKEGPSLKRMSWMEPEAPAANGQLNGHVNGQANGRGAEQSNGTGLSREDGDSAGIALPA